MTKKNRKIFQRQIFKSLVFWLIFVWKLNMCDLWCILIKIFLCCPLSPWPLVHFGAVWETKMTGNECKSFTKNGNFLKITYFSKPNDSATSLALLARPPSLHENIISVSLAGLLRPKRVLNSSSDNFNVSSNVPTTICRYQQTELEKKTRRRRRKR